MHWIEVTGSDGEPRLLNLARVVWMLREEEITKLFVTDTAEGSFEVRETPKELLAKPKLAEAPTADA